MSESIHVRSVAKLSFDFGNFETMSLKVKNAIRKRFKEGYSMGIFNGQREGHRETCFEVRYSGTEDKCG